MDQFELPLTGLYAQLDHQCNLPDIKNLLRDAKEGVDGAARNDVLVSGNKAETIRNIRRAVSLGHLPVDKVYQLLRDAEESGSQHILLLRPESTRIAALVSQGSEVATRLFGEDWGPQGLFPAFTQPEEGYAWADFRVGLPGKPNDWLAKLYGHERIRRSVGDLQTEEDSVPGVIREIRRFKFYDTRTVLVARWNHPHFLELRIDNRGLKSTDTISERRSVLWFHLRKAFTEDEFTGFPIDAALRYLVDRRLEADVAAKYSIQKVELKDPKSGLIKMLPCEHEDFDDEPARAATLQTARAEGFAPNSVRVRWKKCDDSPDSMPDSLVTAIAKTDFGPEISIRKRVSPGVLNYVLNQLCAYSTRAS